VPKADRQVLAGLSEDRSLALADPVLHGQARAARRRCCGLSLSIGLGVVLLSGCSIRQYAIRNLADVISSGGATFASDDDPELIRQALPFSLKLIESLLEETPRQRGLLLAACSGFTQYAHGFVQQDADELGARDLAAATVLWDRARKLYLRARDYGLRGLDSAHPGFATELRQDPRHAVGSARRGDVPLLYWTAASWGGAISVSKDTPDLIADQPIVEALIDRALELDESFEDGAIHTFLIMYEMVRQGAQSTPEARARRHFERAVELSHGCSATALVVLAEAVCVQEQNRSEFERLLNAALAVDVNARPAYRLENLIMQRRARWLLSRADELFVE
jgi:predicted anti-sigma-YlaC factor YlaD